MLRFIFTKTERIPGFEVAHYQALRKLHVLILNFKFRGARRSVLGLVGYVGQRIGLPIFQSYLFSRPLPEQLELDTGGVVEQRDLDIPAELRKSATRYEASSRCEFRYVLESLKIPYSTYDFIDYGSGKGAVLAEAANYPFHSVTGLELSQHLHEVALTNIERLSQNGTLCCQSLNSIQGDATDHQLAPVPHVIYLYNPFGADILKAVLDRLEMDLANVSLPSYLLYNNPMHHAVVAKSSFFQQVGEPMGGAWKLYKTFPSRAKTNNSI